MSITVLVFYINVERHSENSIKDKNGETVLDMIPLDDMVLRGLIRKSQAQSSVSKDDIASGGFPSDSSPRITIHRVIDDDEGSAGSGSGSE